MSGAPSLVVRMRDGVPVLSEDDVDLASAERSNRRTELTAERRAQQAADDGDLERAVQQGLIAFHARYRRSAQIRRVSAAREAREHVSVAIEITDDGDDYTVCACRVMVRGRVGVDFTEEEFAAATGHVNEVPVARSHTSR